MSTALAPGKEAQYYALLAWNGMKSEEAMKLVNSQSYGELDATTYASGSVDASIRGIEKYLLQRGQLNADYVTGEREAPEGYFTGEGERVVVNFETEEELCDAIIKILEEIHNKWVVDNGKKYNRDMDKNDKRLYQHLPTALIGLDEVAKDLMFLAPILSKMGYEVGKMQETEWGSFVPSKAISEAYQRYVEEYKAKNNISSQQDLSDHIKNITKSYDSLAESAAPKGKENFARERIAYMSDAGRVRVLTDSVVAKNQAAFGKDQSSLS